VIRSLELAQGRAGSIPEQLLAAEFLVACGRSDEADGAIAMAVDRMHASRLQGTAATAEMINRLNAVSRRLRQADVARRIEAMGPFADRLMDVNDEAVLHVAEGARTLLVVFGTKFNDFWLSYPVLHCLLPENVSVLYLKDPREMMYLGGLKTYGDGFQALCRGVVGIAERLGISDIRVTGFSSGGYPALLLACAIGASTYLGFSIRSDLSADSSLPNDRYARRPEVRQALGPLMRDLKPWLKECGMPARGILYYGENAPFDAAHALHLAELPNFSVRALPARHNTVIVLLVAGRFEDAMREFLS
jgi:hypothetical protein